tara:strand:+ start:461 stop:925 length:465 start_codon:yes stop_codon:yes gene_type:complete
MNEEERQAQIHGLAALVGHTNSQLKKLDENIVGTSPSLQRSDQAWNPEVYLQQGIQNIMTGAPAPDPEPMQLQPSLQPEPGLATVPAQVAPPVPVATSPEIVDQLNRIEQKLDTFLRVMDQITTLDKKLNSFVDRGLKDKVKQITFKLDDTKHT